jgi:murein DD-endopeptidase MepM/ murein hydrolase activator NlpD
LVFLPTFVLALCVSYSTDVWSVPVTPRFGDLVLLFVRNPDPSLVAGRVTVFGQRLSLVRIDPNHLRAFVPVPRDARAGDHPATIELGSETLGHQVRVFARTFDRDAVSVPSQFTRRPSRKVQSRLRTQQQAFDALFVPDPTEPLRWSALKSPLEGEITGIFGTERMLNRKKPSTHYGLDIDGDSGDPVQAAAPGRVVMAAAHDVSGNTIILNHGAGLFSGYCHLSKMRVRVGDDVEAGHRIGDVGATGRVSGPHLHFEVMVRAVETKGKRPGVVRPMYVDPQRALGLAFGPADPN